MNPIRKAMERLPGHRYKGGITDSNQNYCGLGHLDQVDSGNVGAWDIMDSIALEQYYDRAVSNEE